MMKVILKLGIILLIWGLSLKSVFAANEKYNVTFIGNNSGWKIYYKDGRGKLTAERYSYNEFVWGPYSSEFMEYIRIHENEGLFTVVENDAEPDIKNDWSVYIPYHSVKHGTLGLGAMMFYEDLFDNIISKEYWVDASCRGSKEYDQNHLLQEWWTPDGEKDFLHSVRIASLRTLDLRIKISDIASPFIETRNSIHLSTVGDTREQLPLTMILIESKDRFNELSSFWDAGWLRRYVKLKPRSKLLTGAVKLNTIMLNMEVEVDKNKRLHDILEEKKSRKYKKIWKSRMPLTPKEEYADYDKDGISDIDEINQRLNPLSKDTDEDGANDGIELKYGLDPKDINSNLYDYFANEYMNFEVNDYDVKVPYKLGSKYTISELRQLIYDYTGSDMPSDEMINEAIAALSNKFGVDCSGFVYNIINQVRMANGDNNGIGDNLKYEYDNGEIISLGDFVRSHNNFRNRTDAEMDDFAGADRLSQQGVNIEARHNVREIKPGDVIHLSPPGQESHIMIVTKVFDNNQDGTIDSIEYSHSKGKVGPTVGTLTINDASQSLKHQTWNTDKSYKVWVKPTNAGKPKY